jgi:hypothetical protein
MSSPQQAQQVSRVKKIEWYAGQLVSDAAAKDRAGKIEEAIVDYLQAADLLLLLSKNQENYTVWKAYTDRANSCQQRVKVLIAKKRLEQSQSEQA